MPGDGSEIGWREPYIYFTTTIDTGDGVFKPVPEARYSRCGLFDPNWQKDVRLLKPGEEVVITDWIPAPSNMLEFKQPGRIRLTAHYSYDPGRAKSSMTPPPALGRMTGVPPFELVSASIEFELAPPPEAAPNQKAPEVHGTADPGTADSSSWIKGPLAEVSADGTIGRVPDSTLSVLPVGQPAFKTLSITPLGAGNAGPWTVEGTVVSTNTGMPVPDAAVYVRWDDGRWRLGAVSNLKGEVLFQTRAWVRASGGDARPAFLYVTRSATGLASPAEGTVLREYAFKTGLQAPLREASQKAKTGAPECARFVKGLSRGIRPGRSRPSR
jgi:hypothetical protein